MAMQLVLWFRKIRTSKRNCFCKPYSLSAPGTVVPGSGKKNFFLAERFSSVKRLLRVSKIAGKSQINIFE